MNSMAGVGGGGSKQVGVAVMLCTYIGGFLFES